MKQDEQLLAHEVRLFPSAHITSVREAELRATASLLSMVKAVSEFGAKITRQAGAPRGRLSCYSEVSFASEATGKEISLRPDGVIVVERGKKSWSALLEVKVGSARLEQAQFDAYHQLARELQVDAVITVSNQAAQPSGEPPLSLDRRRTKSVPVSHYSWEKLLNEAKFLCKKKGVSDSDQEWMLDEWIKYVADPGSKIIEAPELGQQWNAVVTAAREGNLASATGDLEAVAANWDSFVLKAALRLRADLGAEVEQWIPRAEKADPRVRSKMQVERVLKTGSFSGELRVPNAIGPISLDLMPQSKTARMGVTGQLPADGRVPTRLNWLLRQLTSLESSSKGFLITIDWDQRGLQSMARLNELERGHQVLLVSPNRGPIPPAAVPKRFRVEKTFSLRKGRGNSSARILQGVFADLTSFYQEVLENLTPWTPRAPRLPEVAPAVPAPVPQQPEVSESTTAIAIDEPSGLDDSNPEEPSL